ncbi:MAG: hypothetical protein GX248_11560 [Peptococcaceae bacterium]|jgi:hypothetical protein|nr:hypothetical protein [Peptococcaceae bacterium]
MWQRIRRELLIEYYWWKRHSGKKRGLDSPLGLMGILIITSAIAVMIIIGQAFAAIFRSMVPIVDQVAGIYWYSITFAFKISLALLILFVSVIVFLIFRFTRGR